MRSKQTAFFYKDGKEGARPSYGNIDCGFTRHLNNKVLVTTKENRLWVVSPTF